MRLWIRGVKVSFLGRLAGLSLRESLVIQKRLKVEVLFLHIKRSHLRWFCHLVKMLPGRLHREMLWVCPTRKWPWGRPRTHRRDYVPLSVWWCLGVLPERCSCGKRGVDFPQPLTLNSYELTSVHAILRRGDEMGQWWTASSTTGHWRAWKADKWAA